MQYSITIKNGYHVRVGVICEWSNNFTITITIIIITKSRVLRLPGLGPVKTRYVYNYDTHIGAGRRVLQKPVTRKCSA